MLNEKKIVVHASNVLGLGAGSVAISIMNALRKDSNHRIAKYILPSEGLLKCYMSNDSKVFRYKRNLPNSISRFLECFISPLFFNRKFDYIILGDIPLYGISNQVVLVHQPNLIYPKINANSSKSLSFRINRFLFKRNLRFTRQIIVQTAVMESELIASYPNLKHKISVVPQPVPDSFKTVEPFQRERQDMEKISLFYPSAGYPHKNHNFLLKIAMEISEKDFFFNVYLTLEDAEYERFKDIPFVKNIGRIPADKMREKYFQFDALLFLSKTESYGLPLVEAMTIGMPIATIDLPYSRWMTENNAFYFKEDDVPSFIQAIQALSKLESYTVNYSKQLNKFPNGWEIVANRFTQKSL